MSVLLQHGHLDLEPLVLGDDLAVDHLVQGQVHDLLEAGGHHVQANSPRGQQRPQLKQGMEAEGGHMRLAPPVPALLHVLLELDPPGGLLPLHVPVLAHEQLLHLAEHGVSLMLRYSLLLGLTENKLNLLRRRSHCRKQNH